MKIIGIVLGAIITTVVIFGLIGTRGNYTPVNNNVIRDGASAKQLSNTRIAFLSGVEKEGSLAGTCVVSDINLWTKPGGIANEAKPKTVIHNGCDEIPIKIITYKIVKNTTFYYIRTNEGKEGWISENFVTIVEKKYKKVFTEKDFFWDQNMLPYKEIIIAGVNKIYQENTKCKEIHPGTACKSSTRGTKENPVFFVTCGSGINIHNVFFSKLEIEQNINQ